MAAIDNIRELAQSWYYRVNGVENDDEDEDLETFENNFIRGFNLWLDEYETETYWNQVRIVDYELTTIQDTTTYAFDFPTELRSPVFSRNKYLKFVVDGTVISKFALVDPNQRQNDNNIDRPNRATFTSSDGDRKIILSRAPTDEEVGATIVLDVVKVFPKLSRTSDKAINLLANKNLAVVGVAKNTTLTDPAKANLSPTFAQQYANELAKAVATNNATIENDESDFDDYSYIGSI